jgi:hypothetical protein
MNDIIYATNDQFGSIANATFTGVCVYFDPSLNELHLNNTTGTLLGGNLIYATRNINNASYGSWVVDTVVPSAIEPFSGQLMYVENRAPVSRFPNQSENIRITMEF